MQNPDIHFIKKKRIVFYPFEFPLFYKYDH